MGTLGASDEQPVSLLRFGRHVRRMVRAGWGRGILATLGGAFLGNYFLLEPLYTIALEGDALPKVTVFCVVGIQISLLSGAMHAAQRRAEADAQARAPEREALPHPGCQLPRWLRLPFQSRTEMDAGGRRRPRVGRAFPHPDGGPRHCRLAAGPDHSASSAYVHRSAQRKRRRAREIGHRDRVYFCHALPLPRTGLGNTRWE